MIDGLKHSWVRPVFDEMFETAVERQVFRAEYTTAT